MIVLATLNARYSHASLALRCLYANLGEYRESARIIEGTLDDLPIDFVAGILEHEPKVVGLSVYIWNAQKSLAIVRLLKQIAPEVCVVVGGPEVSYELDAQEICALADHVVCGPGERALVQVCDAVISQRTESPGHRVQSPVAPEDLELPYSAYTDEDIARRNVYIEASRGCPFRCSFCLSALDKTAVPFPTRRFFAALEELYDRGLRRFKFIDRTFNLDLKFAQSILRFFRERDEECFLHFEMVPDRMPDALIEELAHFSDGMVQLEVGIQTFHGPSAAAVQRRTKLDVALGNMQRLRNETGVHIHADLIAGLPYESVQTFAVGFDRLFAANPHEIQLGILKRLRGFPLAQHEEAQGMRFSREAPYEVLSTPTMSFSELVAMRRTARYYDLIVNQGRFPRSSKALCAAYAADGGVFNGLLALSAALHERFGRAHGIAFVQLAEALRDAMDDAGIEDANKLIEEDFTEDGRRRPPPFLTGVVPRSERKRARMQRQQRHLRS